MKVNSFIEDVELIKKILMHHGWWDTRNHDPTQLDNSHTPAIVAELTYDSTFSRLPLIDYWTR